jgi:uncharacterized protein YidB (DUF937 family)
MTKVVKNVNPQSGQSGLPAPGGGGLLGGLGSIFASGGLGSILGGALGGGSMPSSGGGALGGGGGLTALLPALLPAILNMLGNQSGTGQTGMHQLLDGMHAQGLGGVAQSWVGGGPNQPISATQAASAIGPDKLQQLSAESGLPAEQVSQGLAAILPGMVNHLTPGGTVPSSNEILNGIEGLRSELPHS